MTQPIVTPQPRTIGFDLGTKRSAYLVLEEQGEPAAEGMVSMSRARIVDFFASQPASRVVMEASGSSRWVARIAREHGHEVIVGNPRRIHLVTQSYRKSDRNDAFKLADLGQVRPRLLNPVHDRGDKAYLGQMHQRVRAQLVATRTSLVNLIRGCARSSGHALPKCSTPAFLKRCTELLPANVRAVLTPALDLLAAVGEQIAECDRETKRLGEEVFPETKVLRQVAGVGPVLSLAYVCAIEDPKRFADSREVGSYFGLAPRSRQSGQYAPQMKISKRGDPEVRKLLVSAATYVLGPFGPDCDLRRYGERIAASGSQSARAKARIAVARKLAVLLHRLWISGEVYQPLRGAAAR